MVTPYFFDRHDPALGRAVPRGEKRCENAPAGAPDLPDRSAASLGELHRPIAGFVARAVAEGALPVSVAGDCLAALPVMAGLQRGLAGAGLAPALVWLDAHGDFNTPETSPGGFLGGMPLAMMVGRGDPAHADACGLVPLEERRVWLVGARDLDPLEARALAGSRLHRVGLEALAALDPGRPVHLHIDNDLLDARLVPANNYPVPGGPGPDAVIAACTALAANARIKALSLSGWNGRLPGAGRTARLCRRLLAAIVRAALSHP